MSRKPSKVTDLEEQLRTYLFAHNANSVDALDPEAMAEGMYLAALVKTEIAASYERNRKMLLATCEERLAKMHAARKAALPARQAAHTARQIERVRRALAECTGQKGPAARRLNMGRNTFSKYYAIIKAQDAATPVERCPMCSQPLPSLDTPPRP